MRPPFLPSSTEQNTLSIPPPPATYKRGGRQWSPLAHFASTPESRRLAIARGPAAKPRWGQTTCRWRCAVRRAPVS